MLPCGESSSADFGHPLSVCSARARGWYDVLQVRRFVGLNVVQCVIVLDSPGLSGAGIEPAAPL